MIITITCNPAIDKTIYEDKIVYDVGGKGINVSKVLRNLNTSSLCTGFIGKDNKEQITNNLDDLGIRHNFIEVDGKVRTNTKRIINGELFEENEDGPIISNNDVLELTNYLNSLKNEIVIISGSAPSSVDGHLYEEIIKLLKNNGNYVLLDSSKDLFKYGLKAKPNIIKPNKEEICKYFNIEFDENIIIKKCKELDLDLVVVSLGNDGALFIYRNEVYKAQALKIKCSSSVGAGDSMVASLAYSKVNNLTIEDTIKLAVSTSACACQTEGTKPPEFADIIDNIKKVKIERR